VQPEFEASRPNRDIALYRAFEALSGLACAPDAADDPLVVVAHEVVRAAGDQVNNRNLARTLAKRHAAYGRHNPRRYRWSLSYNAEPGSTVYLQPPGPRAHWRPAEAEWLDRDRSGYGRRLMEPIVIAAQFGYWGRIAENRDYEPEIADFASSLVDEALPVAEHDIAALHMALDPWRDTFALWVLTSEPQAAGRLRDLLFTLAIRYGSIAARDGLVRGIRHPWFQRPLVSASAHLASSLWHWGTYPSVVPKLVSFVAVMRNADGSWADENQPADILTTLAAADLLTRLDPGFDPTPTVAWLIAQQEESGWWRALDPEVPWLTAAVARWLRQAELPFTQRFDWPSAPIWARDRMTGLTTLAALEELAIAMGQLPRLADEPTQAAFLDLAGFRAFNSRHGSQDEGDRLLSVLGGALRDMPGVLPVRIGGDEMLILGKPGADIAATIEAWRMAWPGRLRAAGFTDPVAPRILIGSARTGELTRLRRELGEGIFRMKQTFAEVPPEGVQATLD
jgi:GGDEF domain-containing protein